MELESNYEISRTASFIQSRNFTRVALQFPDELLKDSTRVVSSLHDKLQSSEGNASDKDVGLYVMADTTYGSCCVDEVGAAHINANCVIHYGHTCLSPYYLVGTLGVAGYLKMIHQMKELKAYTLVMGRPNPEKLANFPEGKSMGGCLCGGIPEFNDFISCGIKRSVGRSTVFIP